MIVNEDRESCLSILISPRKEVIHMYSLNDLRYAPSNKGAYLFYTDRENDDGSCQGRLATDKMTAKQNISALEKIKSANVDELLHPTAFGIA